MMSKAVRCPVCDGRGTIANPGAGVNNQEITCHGCSGKGWVEVSEARLELSPLEEPKIVEINISIPVQRIDVSFIGKGGKVLSERVTSH